MYRILLTLTCAFLAGCSKNEDGESGVLANGERTAELLQSGSPKACSTSDVRETVFSVVKPSFRPDGDTSGDDIELALSKFSYGLDTVTLENIDQTVHNVTCEANLVITDSEKGKREFPIRYVVKPSVDDPQGFVVALNSGEAKSYLQAAASEKIGEARDTRLADEAGAAPSPPADTTAAPAETPSDDALKDVSNAIGAENRVDTSNLL